MEAILTAVVLPIKTERTVPWALKGIAKQSPFMFPLKEEMHNLLPLLSVLTYLDSDEFGAGICERNVYLLKNRKT